jgi:uncharacterized membrane protein
MVGIVAVHVLQLSETVPAVHVREKTPAGDSAQIAPAGVGSPTCHRYSLRHDLWSLSQPWPMKAIGGRTTRKAAIDWLTFPVSCRGWADRPTRGTIVTG